MDYMIRFVLILRYAAMACGEFQENPSAVLVPSSVVSDFTQQNPKASNFTVLLEARISDRNDLFVVCATEWRQPSRSRQDRLFLQPKDLFGVYLRQRGGPTAVKLILEQAGVGGPELQVAHFGPSEIVLWRFDDLGIRLKTLKLFFDSESPRLLARVEYEPFRVTRIIDDGGIPHFIAGDMKQTLVVRPSENADGFVIENATEAKDLLASLQFYSWTTPGESFRYVMPERHPTRRFGPGRRFLLSEESLPPNKELYSRITETTSEGVQAFALPQSTWDEFEKLRPKRVKDGYKRNIDRIEEEIGPNQVVGNRLWFGKRFDDAEGITGIGGFGYFDCEERRFQIYSPPEIRDSSVTSLLVNGDNVWMSTSVGGEFGFLHSAILQWNIAKRLLRSYEFDATVFCMTQYCNNLFLATDEGIAVLTQQGFRRYLIDVMMEGKHRIVRR